MPPSTNLVDEFRSYSLALEGNLFEELLVSVRFQDVTKGRQGTVLVKNDARRGTPIVRTTTKYSGAAQCFRTVHANLAELIRKKASLHAYAVRLCD